MAKIEEEEKEVNLWFFSSVCAGNFSEMKKMLLRGADINILKPYRTTNLGLIKLTALMVASYLENKTVLKLLIENGANIDLKNYDGVSALEMAIVYKGNVDVVKLLLEHGAKPNQTNNRGYCTSIYMSSH